MEYIIIALAVLTIVIVCIFPDVKYVREKYDDNDEKEYDADEEDSNDDEPPEDMGYSDLGTGGDSKCEKSRYIRRLGFRRKYRYTN